MSKTKWIDPYVYPGTNTLINKFDIKDSNKLQELEAIFFLSKKSDPLPSGNFDFKHLKAIHNHYFGDVYSWAGKERTINIAKGDSHFAHTQYITSEITKLFTKLKNDNHLQNFPQNDFSEKLSYYFNEVNAIHPFREGNGRTQRAFFSALADKSGYYLDWTAIKQEKYIEANISGFIHGDYDAMTNIFKQIISPLKMPKIESPDTPLQKINWSNNTKNIAITPSQRAYYDSRYTQIVKEYEQGEFNRNNLSNSRNKESDIASKLQKSDKEIEV